MVNCMMALTRSFYERSPALVAKELLGKVLVHRPPEGVTSGRIVETEAYFGKGDPASRASRKRTKLVELMWWHGGLAFIYMVHNNWMFNATSNREGVPGAVLIRAIEPMEGIDLMRLRRGVDDDHLLTSGPGRMTKAMGITYEHHKLDLTKSRILTILDDAENSFKTSRSHRIGVREDLKRELRFFIEGNQFVSR